MGYLFTSESVSEGHPDKVSDQISDALLDEFLRFDPESKVACETLCTTGLVVCAGEVKTRAYVEIQDVVRRTVRKIGYTKAEYRFDADSCGVISTIHGQSPDINQGVERTDPREQGAGDQGMMFGYAVREMDNFMPLPIELAHMLLQEMADIRNEGKLMTYLRPDAKSQVTVEYDDSNQPVRIETIVVSTQHDDFIQPENDSFEAKSAAEAAMLKIIEADIRNIVLPQVIENQVPEKFRKLFDNRFKLFVNPTGKFVIGGPHGDSGLTGRKIIVDTYGGKGAHGGGAFSGKDPSKVDRSAAYAARHIAKNLVAAGVAHEVLVQVAYAIGVAQPVGVYVNTFGTASIKNTDGQILSDGLISKKVSEIFDLRPYSIIQRFGLKNPIFEPTASYGHFGRNPYEAEVEVGMLHFNPDATNSNGGPLKKKKVQFFGWEKLDYVDKVKTAFGI
jgi:S-adenosylmethionine synthetase